jgi:hypothetical protein
MKTMILAYIIAFGGFAMVIFGVWGLYSLSTDRAAERRARDYLSPIQPIGVGLVLIGLARALLLLLVILAARVLVR